MRFMIIIKRTAREMPDQALLTAMTKYNEELVKAGIMLGGEGLHPTSRVRVKFGTNRTVVEGPFQSLIAGYWLWQVRRARRPSSGSSAAPAGESEIEIRQVFEAADFGAEFTPELRPARRPCAPRSSGSSG